MKKITIVIISIIGLLLSGCSNNVAPGDYNANEVGKINKVVPGVIISKRAVKIHSNTSIMANNSQNSVENSDTATMHPAGFQYVIRLNSGEIISLVQDEDLKLKPKQHVLVVYGPITRVVADNGSDKD